MRFEHVEDRVNIAPELTDAVLHALDELERDQADKGASGARDNVGEEGREERNVVGRACAKGRSLSSARKRQGLRTFYARSAPRIKWMDC